MSRPIAKAAVFLASLAALAAVAFGLAADRDDVALRKNGSFVVSAYGLDGRAPQYESLFLVDPGAVEFERILNRAGLHQPDWSPDGTRVVFVGPGPGRRGDIFVIGADGSALRRLTATPLEEGTPTWSPDGARIAFAREGALWVMDADGSDQTPLLQSVPPGLYQAWPSWSPDGTRIAFVRPFDRGIFDTCPKNTGTGVFVMDANGSEPHRLTIEGCRHRVAWSPSGEQLAIVGARGWVKVLDAEGATIDSFRPPDLPPGQIAFATAGPVWSPDGRLLALSLEGDIWTLDIGSREWRQVTRDTGLAITDLDWAPSPGATVVP